MTTLGLIGAGNIGSQLARAAVAHGYDVVVSNSRGPESLTELILELGEKATAGTTADAAHADLVAVAIPLKAVDSIPADLLDGRIVIDTSNYYPQRDGNIDALDAEQTTVSELVQNHFSGARLVKAFNHIQSDAITDEAQSAGTAERRALIVASDDDEAKAAVAEFIDAIGFDVLDIGPLSESWRIQVGTPAYGPRRDREELEIDIAQAERPSGS
ncbi:NADP oxidoreductase [Mycetocola manganoxydans]|uniref:NADP oxidoreductase n=1 Tax=Mycetocola manganoxydans TaxID=699879 RepID=A0A3L7A027_9MICO|nr:NADPH-dependent F420 reductase [Mycetocola manganoxydans]RLP73001.1 NADP oxidoreductase [Mycetocola manganoxydans]GHD44608.1 NADP oxidoreductase [Mycetocola manganoxydans]